jgi:hypothetical protein
VVHGAKAKESSGADGERGKKVEEEAVVLYIGLGRSDVAQRGGEWPAKWGEVWREGERGGIRFRIPAISDVGAGWKVGRRLRGSAGRVRGVGDVHGHAWERRAAAVAGAGGAGRRLGMGLTGGPHLSMSRREEGARGGSWAACWASASGRPS